MKTRITTSLVSILLFGFGLPCFGDTVERSPYGICSHLQGGEEHRQMPQNLELMTQAGIRWVRADFSWSGVQNRDGRWKFDHLDRVVSETKKNGMQVLPILNYDVPWATPAYKHLDLWLAYVEKTVSRYKNEIKYWEVWNEPNLKGFWRDEPNGADYKRLLEATYKKIKEIDPTLVVLYGGLAGIPFDYFEESFKVGAADFFDVFNIHPYRPGMSSIQASRAYEADIEKMFSILKRYGAGDKKVWITEFGWATPPAAGRSHKAMVRAAKGILAPENGRWRIAVLRDADYPASQSFSKDALEGFFFEEDTVTFIKLPDLKMLRTSRFDVLYLPPSELFPTPYLDDILGYVADGGTLFLSGGVPLYYQTQFDQDRKNMLVRKEKDARPDDDRRRLRIGWSAWWTDKSGKTPEFAPTIVSEDAQKFLEGVPEVLQKASRFLNGTLLKDGDRLIPILLGQEKDFEGVAAGIFKFDSDMKGAVVVSTIMGMNDATTEEDQARYLPQAILLSRRFGIERYFWYEFQSVERDETDKEHHFGVVHRQLDPKPAYQAYSTLTRVCPAGSTIDRSVPWIRDELCVISWKREDGTPGWAVWSPGGSNERVVEIGPGFRAAIDMYGKKIPAVQGKTRMTFDPGVVYFIGPETLHFP